MAEESLLRKIINKITGQKIQVDISKTEISRYLPANPVIIEAGVFNGEDTLQMLALWKNAIIYGFEPVPDIYALAKKRLSRFPQVILSPLALSDKTGESAIHISSGESEASSSLLMPKDHLKVHPSVTFNSTIMVNTISLNDWAARYQISRVDLMWLDLQGSEYMVLKAGEQLLGNTGAIFTEVSLIETYKGVVLYPELRTWLESLDFSVAYEQIEHADMGNVLFVKNSILSKS